MNRHHAARILLLLAVSRLSSVVREVVYFARPCMVGASTVVACAEHVGGVMKRTDVALVFRLSSRLRQRLDETRSVK